ncbi:MAG TPA: lipopolysaccharide kinase InaA family protein [Methylotenera sp.]|jgi:tRNA A-37 threonylcarbamoyl transferase component Bud32
MAEAKSTLQQLAAFGFHTGTLLLADGSQLEVRNVVRTVPGKRLVCRCVWNAQNVYAKIFVGKNAERHAGRDARGVTWLSQAGIATPALLCSNELADRPAKVLVFAEVSDAVNAEQQLLTLEAAQKLEFAGLLVQEVAAHHRRNLIQTDLYLKNFLIKANVVYTLDGDGIRQLSGFCQKRRKLANLATLLSKFDALDDGWIKDLYARYCSHTGVLNKASDQARLMVLTQKIRQTQASTYADKKVFRNCTDVKVLQAFDSFKAIATGSDIDNIDTRFLDAVLVKPERNIKNGNTCTIGIAELADKKIVVKRYNIKHFWHGFSRAFRVSRAAQSWANAHRLLISNVPTAKPLALVEQRWGIVRRRAYYLSEYVDAPDAKQFFAQCASADDRLMVARRLAALLHKLYLLRYTHGDFKATNVKIVNLKPLLIDLDAMQAHRLGYCFDWWFERKHIKDLKRLMKNWQDDAEVTHLLMQALRLEYASQDINAGDNILIRAGIV